MKNDANITSFINAIDDEAKKISDEINRATQTYINDELESAKKGAKAQADKIVERRTKEISSKSGRALAKEQAAVREEIYSHRAELENRVFAAAAKRLDDFVKSKEYEYFLMRLLEAVNETYGEDCKVVVRISERDASFADMIARTVKAKCHVETDSSIKLGGIISECPELNIIADDTIDERLARQRAEFRGVKELIIE